MKNIVILMDGMADYPIEALGNKTPMEVAVKPNIDALAKKSEVFLVKTVPESLKPGSDVANLAVMGYNPEEVYTGRSPLEAASIGVELSDTETTFRANLVTLGGEGEYEDLYMKDYSSEEITTEEAAELIECIKENIQIPNISFYAGTSYRHLMVWDNAPESFKLTPPHDISGKAVAEYLPSDPVILNIMKQSREILKNHPVNIARKERGLNTADSLWIWGEGKRPALAPFKEMYNVNGAVISAVDLIKGIGQIAKMKVIEVDGATGNINSNFDGKAKAALETILGDCDYLYLHMEAPDECGHRGETDNKIKSIELIDQKVVGYLTEGLKKAGIDFRMMIMPDHPTPIATRTHARDAVPCLIYDSTDEKQGPDCFCEKSAEGRIFEPGYKIASYFIK